MTALVVLDFIAVALFAASGALAAARKGLDLIGLIWLAALTGIGGGTFRDLLLGLPVFWVHQPVYLGIAAAVSALVFVLARVPARSETVLLWLDALGLAFVSVAGAKKAMDFGAPPSTAVLMGVLTGTLGGVLRDVLANEPSVLLRKEIYITASLLGATVYVVAVKAGLGQPVASVAGLVAGFGLRAGALIFGWSLPGARLGRE
ncbi:MAG: trimeric intracellular cation channel family protein [Proteobacteria bacterium]|nr:trimeric intracellular cation channel family protein [Pseudomonadota bacterium]